MYTKFSPSFGGNGRSGESAGNVKLWNNLEGLAYPDLDVDCRENGVLQSFELQFKTGDAALWRYAFVCCKGTYPAAGIGRFNSKFNYYTGNTIYFSNEFWFLDRSVPRFPRPRASRKKLTRAECPMQTNSIMPLLRPCRALVLRRHRPGWFTSYQRQANARPHFAQTSHQAGVWAAFSGGVPDWL